MLKNIPDSIRDIGKLISGNVATKAIGIAVLAFYARVLSKEEMAIFPVYIMLSDLSSLILSFGIMPNLIKLLPSLLKKDIQEAQSLITTGGLLIISGTAIVSGFVFFFSDQINRLLLNNRLQTETIQIMTVGFIALSISKVAEQVLWAAGRFGYKSLLTVGESLVRPCCTISFFLLFGIKGLVTGIVLSQIIKAAMACFWIRDIYFVDYSGFYPLRRLLKQSLPFYLESYLMYFRREGDNWIVSTMLGPASLAVYYIAKTVYNSCRMFFYSVDQVVTRELASYKLNRKLLLQKAYDVHANISLFSIPGILLVITLLPLAVPIIAGIAYQAAITPATILLLALLVDFQRISISRTVFVTLNPGTRFYITLIETLVLLPSLFILSYMFGSSGIAGARLLSQVIGGVVGYWILFRKLSFTLEYKAIIILFFTSVLVSYCMLLLQSSLKTQGMNLCVQSITIPLWIVLTGGILMILSCFFNINIAKALRLNEMIGLLKTK